MEEEEEEAPTVKALIKVIPVQQGKWRNGSGLGWGFTKSLHLQSVTAIATANE
jgi:hypothetical protein